MLPFISLLFLFLLSLTWLGALFNLFHYVLCVRVYGWIADLSLIYGIRITVLFSYWAVLLAPLARLLALILLSQITRIFRPLASPVFVCSLIV